MRSSFDPSMPSGESSALAGAEEKLKVVFAFDEGGRSLGRATGVFCPGCHGELVIGELDSCQFAGCPQCKGMMFQQDVFGMLIQHLRAVTKRSGLMPKPMDPDELKVRRACPTCESVMETHAYGGPGNAVIDTCFPCGIIFLDRSELTKLVSAPGKR